MGSFAFHGPRPSWAGPAHDWPIIALAVMCAVGLVLTVRRRPRTWMAAAAIFLIAFDRLCRRPFGFAASALGAADRRSGIGGPETRERQ
ncbi:hypothetical protein [Mycolicibacterium rhodesiae]|uniref:hypothetical protein n=1 Tax=Mycolicibacterium rhodesiae TaxID=36814 RepID=UPI0002F7FEC5|nr:hypothetical protein [Mycolicibacterium rhodesiae]